MGDPEPVQIAGRLEQREVVRLRPHGGRLPALKRRQGVGQRLRLGEAEAAGGARGGDDVRGIRELRRLEENGWASGYWGPSENNRKARYYAITKAGQKQLAREKQNWKSITSAVEKVLEGA